MNIPEYMPFVGRDAEYRDAAENLVLRRNAWIALFAGYVVLSLCVCCGVAQSVASLLPPSRWVL